MAGIAAEVLPKIALNWAMIKAAPEQGRAVLGKPATANTNLALAIRAINTLAPAPVTPAAPALLAAANILLAPAPLVMSGTAVAVRNKFSTELKVICIIATARWSALRLAVWASMLR